MQPEIYLSTDIETNGPRVGENSMLSLASAAFLADKTLLDTFTVNLEALPEGKENAKTMEWWQQFPEAWQATRSNCQSPAVAMQAYATWLKQFKGRLIFVGYPVIFDFPFVNYYLERFAKENPLGYACIDIRSYVMGMRKTTYGRTSKRYWPERWLEDRDHPHIALDDAIEQGIAFCNMLIENHE